jgi:hypothetical protein
VHEIDRAVRETDVIKDVIHLAPGDLPTDRSLNQIAELSGFLDSRAAFGTEMEDELTAVGVRKEILPEPWHEKKRRGAGKKKCGDEEGPPTDKCDEQCVIDIPKAPEASLERLLEPHEGIP